MIDMFASEYGWSVDYIKFELPLDEAARLVHAILYRRGVKTFKRKHEIAEGFSLQQKIKEASKSFDTAHELEGITF